MEKGKKISVLIPCYNEKENAENICAAVKNELDKLDGYDYEIVFIDNRSTDGTREILERLCAEDRRVKAIFNARNFGQFNSPFYGYLQTTGDCTISMCCDFQDPPELIGELVKKWENGAKIVYCVKKTSHENHFVRFLRTLYYKAIGKMSEVEQIEHFTGFGLYDKSFIDVLRNLDDPAPFIRGIVAELGYEKVELSYDQPKRRAGKSSNGFSTLYDAAMLSFTSYTKTPVRFFTFIGVLLSLLSVAAFITLTAVHYAAGINLSMWIIISAVAFFFSVAYLGIGVLGEYILNVRTKVTKRPLVIEEKRINFDDEK